MAHAAPPTTHPNPTSLWPTGWRIGITGGIGAGKSLVGHHLAEQGHPVIDADAVVHALYDDPAVLNQVATLLGSGVITPQHGLDRQRLAALIFQDAEAKQQLERLIHPMVRQRMHAFYAEHAHAPVVFGLVPLLFENGLQTDYDQVWVIHTPEPLLRERLAAQRGYSPQETTRRLANQWSVERKRQLADWVADNTGTPEHLLQQVDLKLAQLLSAPPGVEQ